MYITDQRYTKYNGLGKKYALTVDPTVNTPDKSPINMLRLQNLLARELRKSYDSGRFPAIQEVQIIEMQNHGGSDDYDEWRQNTVDIVNQHISVVPTAPLAFSGVLADDPSIVVDSTSQFWASLPGPDDKIIIPSANEFDIHVFKAWTTSTTGIRVPTGKINDRALQKLVFRPNQLSGLGWSEFLEKVRNARSENETMWMEEDVKVMKPHLRAPYTIKGLLEWYD